MQLQKSEAQHQYAANIVEDPLSTSFSSIVLIVDTIDMVTMLASTSDNEMTPNNFVKVVKKGERFDAQIKLFTK